MSRPTERGVRSQIKLLKETSKQHDSKEILHCICFNVFETWKHPYVDFITFCVQLPDIAVPQKKTITGCVIYFFDKWVEKNSDKEEISEEHLTERIKALALKEICAVNCCHLPLIAKIYKCSKENSQRTLENHIRYLCNQRNYKTALMLANTSNMKDTFDFEDFLLPRAFQDDYKAVEEYCTGHPKLEASLIEFLDHFFSENCAERIAAMEFRYGKELVQRGKTYFATKSIKSKIKDFLDKRNLTDEKAPHFAWDCKRAELVWIIRQCFVDHEVDYPSYIARVKRVLSKASPHQRHKVCDIFLNIRNIGLEDRLRNSALWAVYLKSDPSNLPPTLVSYMNEYPNVVEELQIEIAGFGAPEPAFEMKLGGKPITFIDTMEELKLLEQRFNEDEIFAIDSECVSEIVFPSKIALVQLAFKKEIYLIDLFTLFESRKLSTEARNEFFSRLYEGKALKLGFNFCHDLKSSSFKSEKNFETTCKNCICLQKMYGKITEELPEFQEKELAKGDLGNMQKKLSTVCTKMLGITLDKLQQNSDWAERPLRKTQVEYAALDADILFQLYEEFERRSAAQGINFDQIIGGCLVNMNVSTKTKKIKHKRDLVLKEKFCEIIQYEAAEGAGEKRSPSNFKFTTDSMFLHLGKNLRKCGIDTLVCEEGGDFLTMVRCNPDRISITLKKIYDMFEAKWPGRMEPLDAFNQLDQLKHFLKKFNILVKEEDVGSRCLECNYTDFLRVPGVVIEALVFKHITVYSLYHSGKFDELYWKNQIKNLDDDGTKCAVESGKDFFIVYVNGGIVDIYNNTVFSQKTKKWLTAKPKQKGAIEAKQGYCLICLQCGDINSNPVMTYTP